MASREEQTGSGCPGGRVVVTGKIDLSDTYPIYTGDKKQFEGLVVSLALNFQRNVAGLLVSISCLLLI